MTFNLPGPYKGKFQFTDCLLEFQFTADQFISIYHALILDFKSKFIDGDFNLPTDSISIYPATQLTIYTNVLGIFQETNKVRSSIC